MMTETGFSKKDSIFAVLKHWFPMFLLVALGITRINTFQIGTYYDDAWYVATSTAIAKGMGYVRLWTPDLRPETLLPVGYPALLSILRRTFPNTFFPLQLLSLLASVGVLVLSNKYYQRRLNSKLAWFLTLALAVNVNFVGFSTLVMSEMVFMFFTFLVVFMSEESSGKKENNSVYILIGITAAIAYFVRSWGIALIAAVALYYLWQRRWRGALLTSIPFIVMCGFWSYRNTALGGVGASYGLSIRTLPYFMSEYIAGLNSYLWQQLTNQWLQNLSSSLVPLLFGPKILSVLDNLGIVYLAWMISCMIIGLIILGYCIQFRRHNGIAEIFTAFHAIILTLAPIDGRYWLPLIPFLLLYLIQGSYTLITRLTERLNKRHWARIAVTVLLLSLTVLNLARDIQATVNPVRYRIPDVALGATWIKNNTPEDATIMAQVPRVTYLYSNRTVVPFPDGGDGHRFEIYPELLNLEGENTEERFYVALQYFDVDYVLIEPELRAGLPFAWSDYITKDILPILINNRTVFELVYSDATDLIRIYRVVYLEDE